ncbi:hypothetical protein BDV30DRAFT_229308 [Aspergillus minisclerotigenes]|uniref:Uncharacterized protein n=1 Tax=Aspergillus minisclerotigenes TaxID=656917 RepID=A0A5N6IXQ7_9EURO|nr:hypothetical protein BDV30DRAFT_229308 [Aspergillus minisclerotigenes]
MYHTYITLFDLSLNGTIVSRRWNDGEGTYVGSDSVHHYASGVKCWNDYFVVQQEITYGSWEAASGKTYCTGTQICQVSKMMGAQHCKSISISVTAGISSDLFNAGVSAGYDVQDCSQATDTTACTWNDGGCHIVWTQQQQLSQTGYTRRRCSSKDGDYTAWMQDFTNVIPTSYINYGCGSSCDDSP